MADRRRLTHMAQSLEEMLPEECTEVASFWAEDKVSLRIDVQRAVGELAPLRGSCLLSLPLGQGHFKGEG